MIKDRQEENQWHLTVSCDYGVQDAECLHGNPLTKWFLYQTVCLDGNCTGCFPKCDLGGGRWRVR